MSDINFQTFTEEVGLHELAKIDKNELAGYFMPAAIAGLADGDIAALHRVFSEERMIRLYGRSNFNEGEVAKKILAAAISNGPKDGPVQDFQNFAAEYFSAPSSPFASAEEPSSIRVYHEAVTIDNDPLLLPKPPAVILEYGSCLVSRSFVDDQLTFLRRGDRPFVYCPITRSRFINRSIMHAYDTKFGPNTSNAFIDNHLYIGREDGAKSATDEIIEMQTKHTGRCDIADIIVCAGPQHSTPEDVQAGIYNASKILKAGGILIIRSMAKPASNEIGTDQIADWAYESGFPENGVQFSSTYHSLGHLILTGVEKRLMKSVVLTR